MPIPITKSENVYKHPKQVAEIQLKLQLKEIIVLTLKNYYLKSKITKCNHLDTGIKILIVMLQSNGFFKLVNMFFIANIKKIYILTYTPPKKYVCILILSFRLKYIHRNNN